jgi:peroxiredoxin
MFVDDGVVKAINIEEAPGKCELTSGEALLGQI